MTLTDRQHLIDRTLRNVEDMYPCASSATLFELASSMLARSQGLAVSPDEIMQTLSALAEVVE